MTTELQKNWLTNYRGLATTEVSGWLNASMFDVLDVLNTVQRGLAVRGGIMEIGVHHGRFFMPLNALVEEGEGQSYAIDLFEDQDRNIDRSGKGNRGQFLENMSRFDRHQGKNVACIKGDSTRLLQSDLNTLRDSKFKIISIDGGHTVEHTINDLQIASSCVHEAGIVILDDVPNQQWIGVTEGLICYLQQRPTLWPIMIGFNKVVLVPMSFHAYYLKAVRPYLGKVKVVQLCGYPLFSLLSISTQA